MTYLHWLNWRYNIWFVLGFCVFSLVVTWPSIEPENGVDPYWMSVFGVWAGYFAGLLSGGNGIRALWLPGNHSLVYYVLSLPVKRRVILLAHIATTAMVAVVVNTLSLAYATLVMRSKGIEVMTDTFGSSVLLSHANAVAVALGLIALASLLRTFWCIVAGVAFAGAYALLAGYLASPAGSQSVLWSGLGLAAAVAGVSLLVTLRFAPKGDY